MPEKTCQVKKKTVTVAKSTLAERSLNGFRARESTLALYIGLCAVPASFVRRDRVVHAPDTLDAYVRARAGEGRSHG